jgi:hypothetical protein
MVISYVRWGGRNYETGGPTNNGRSALRWKVSSIRLFASVCVSLTSPPDKDNRLVHQTFEKVSIDYQERHLRLLAH